MGRRAIMARPPLAPASFAPQLGRGALADQRGVDRRGAGGERCQRRLPSSPQVGTPSPT
jgi:hypothetical protein